MLQALETAWAPRVLSIARVVTALIFMAHGTQKLLNFPPRANNARARESCCLLEIPRAAFLEIYGGTSGTTVSLFFPAVRTRRDFAST